MKKLLTSLVLAILTVAISFFVYPTSTIAQSIYVTPTVETLNVRAGPSTDYAIVGVLRRGESVRWLDKVDYSWDKIDYQGRVAYVFSDYVTNASTQAAPAPAPVRAPAAPQNGCNPLPQQYQYASYRAYLDAYYGCIGGGQTAYVAPSPVVSQAPQPVYQSPASSCPAQQSQYGNYNDYLNAYYQCVGTASNVTSAPSTNTQYQQVQASPAQYDDGSAYPISAYDCPSTHPIKGNANSGIYHMPFHQFYSRTKPEACFSNEGAAQAAGYRRAYR